MKWRVPVRSLPHFIIMETLNIKSDLDQPTLAKLVSDAVNEYKDPNKLTEMLLDLLGYDNIEAVFSISQNPDAYRQLEPEIPEQQKEVKDDTYYANLVQMLGEVTGWARSENVYLLNRVNFDLNEALDSFYASQNKIALLDSDGNEIPREEDKPSDIPENSNVEQFANLQVVDTERITQVAFKNYELDLHMMGYHDAVEQVRLRVNELAEIQQKLVEKGKKAQISLKIITGRGAHSEGQPVIKMGVLRLLKAHAVPHFVQESTKGGVIIVRIRPGQSLL